jgi:putative cell wall-binding protein
MQNKVFFKCLLSSVLLASSIVLMPSNKVLAATTQRLQGSNRYETSISISKSGWETSDNAILASGLDFPDALSAAPLAKQLNAPILLIGQSLDTSINNELKRLQVKNIFIVGGEGVISKSIKDQLVLRGITVTRLSGNNRYETSLSIANYIIHKFNLGTEIVVASGEGFPDALSIAPIAAIKGMPIILSPKNQLPDSVKRYVADNKVTKAFVVGGTGVVSDKVKQALPLSERVWGSDRYKTNIAILKKFVKDLNFHNVYIATGIDFPDALSGSALAAKKSSPIILMDKTMPISTVDYMIFKLPSVNKLWVLGGEGVVPKSVLINNFYGNTSGNNSNFGFFAKQGDWIYYFNSTLYKIKTDGTSKTELSKDMPVFINVVGEWVYYIEVTSGTNQMYKVKIDGTSRTKLSGDKALYMTVVQDWIYYMNISDEGKLYKMRTDGTSKTKVADEVALEISISRDWVYYTTILETGASEIHKVKKDGTGLTMLYGATSISFLNVSGDYLYFETSSLSGENGDMVKVKNDGTNYSTICDDTSEYINVYGEWVYYSNASDNNKLYKIKIDGTGKTKINDDDAMYINVVGGWIYYATSADTNTIKVKIDGTERQIVD